MVPFVVRIPEVLFGDVLGAQSSGPEAGGSEMKPQEDQLLLLPQVTPAHPSVNSDSPQSPHQARVLLLLGPPHPRVRAILPWGGTGGFVWASCIPVEPYSVTQIRAQGLVKCLKWAKPRGETRIPSQSKIFQGKVW